MYENFISLQENESLMCIFKGLFGILFHLNNSNSFGS